MGWAGRAGAGGLDYAYAARAQAAGLLRRRAPRAFERGSGAPVVLLAGVWEPWSLLAPCASALNAAGHPVHVVAALGYNSAPIETAAATAAAYLRERDLRGVVLVAHSKGGLVGKRLLAAEDAEGRVDRLVAIATPFAGARLARLVPSRTIRALGPLDEAIVRLGAERAVNARITSIFGEHDPHIPEGSRLEGATNVELPVVGHFRLLGDRRVIEAVVAAAG